MLNPCAPHRLVGADPEHKGWHAGADARCRCAAAAMVYDCTAAREDLTVVGVRDEHNIRRGSNTFQREHTGTDQGPLAQLAARFNDHRNGVSRIVDRHTTQAKKDGRAPYLDPSFYGGVGIRDKCKVDDLAGHRLGEIIAFREGLHRVFFR